MAQSIIIEICSIQGLNPFPSGDNSKIVNNIDCIEKCSSPVPINGPESWKGDLNVLLNEKVTLLFKGRYYGNNENTLKSVFFSRKQQCQFQLLTLNLKNKNLLHIYLYTTVPDLTKEYHCKHLNHRSSRANPYQCDRLLTLFDQNKITEALLCI